MSVHIALIGDYNSEVIAHQSIPKALKYSSEFLNIHLLYDWINTETIKNELEERLQIYNGIWVVPASPY